jgi:colicin import membrane protein
MTFISAGKRRHEDGVGLNNMIVLSFLLHALVLSIILFSPSWPTPKWTFGPVYDVDLVSVPLSSVEAGYDRPVSGKIIGINSGEHSSVIKKNTDTIRPISIEKTKTRKIEPGKTESSGEVGKAIDGIKNKVLSSKEGASSSAVASRGHVEMNMKMRVYYSLIWSKVRQEWVLPEGILHDDNLVAVIDAKILRNGNVDDIGFEKRSGNRYFDESAIKAIRKASPFPPLPEWIKDNYIEVGVRFHSSELR